MSVKVTALDWAILISFFVCTLVIGIWVSKKSGKDTSEFFLSGRSMPWWLLGFSMVATTFSADTPLLVTDIVRGQGVAGNWVWWVFLLTGMLTVFIYARLWRRSNVTTDMEFYELRYSGPAARFLRGFRSIYLGLIFNIMVMAVVTLAAIKIGGIMLGLTPWQVVLSSGVVIVIFSAIGGFRGVVYTDFILFILSMIGAVAAAYYAVTLPEVGGLSSLLTHEAVSGKMTLLPNLDDRELVITLLVIPLAIQWWSAWYPGAEPGGGGYIAQRMLAAKNENHAIGATFFFNIMHYAIRPWPWILVALASLVVFPDIASLQKAFPDIPLDKLGNDMAYPAMLNHLPAGLFGLLLASLLAAYMSTMSTHLNWGASYVVNDFYRRFIRPEASEASLVNVGRIATVVMMVVSALVALELQNAKQIFDIIILFGAGTGGIFILRWFWWRINAWSEISAMFASGIISIIFNFTSLGNDLFGHYDALGVFYPGALAAWVKFPLVVLLTTVVWIATTYLTPPEDQNVLSAFYDKIQPGSKGWTPVIKRAERSGQSICRPQETTNLPMGILAMLLGTIFVYSILFCIGQAIYQQWVAACIWAVVAVAVGLGLRSTWTRSEGGWLN